MTSSKNTSRKWSKGDIGFVVLAAATIVAFSIAELKTRQRQSGAAAVPQRVVSAETFSLRGGFRRGSPSARKQIVLFTSFGCHQCDNTARALDTLLALDSSVALVERQFIPSDPINVSVMAARVALCAGHAGEYQAVRNAFISSPVATEDGRWSDILLKAGVTDTTATLACAKSAKYADLLEADKNAALALGLRTVPAILIGDSLFVTELVNQELGNQLRDARRAREHAVRSSAM